jgi:hypothetical protein
MTPHPAIADWLEVVEKRKRRWLDAVASNDPSADLLLSSLELAKKRLAAAIKYSGQPQNPKQSKDAQRPTAW